ncbi:phenylalanine--tRNA ligase subunit beta [Conglomerata obtusa]
MPTISINKTQLHKNLELPVTFDITQTLFDFGLEIDDVIIEDGETIYKIEVGANRYDLLCMEGLTNALRVYLQKEEYTDIKEYDERYMKNANNCNKIYENEELQNTQDKPIEQPYIVYHENQTERPYIACAIICGINFTPAVYKSFIDYQDKLHSSLGRDRTIVAIGTHDLFKIKFPVTYTKIKKEELQFVPLNQKLMTGDEMIKFYNADNKMKNYCKLLSNEFPAFVDACGNILSVPPLINSDHSKLHCGVKNIFVEVTGNDFYKVNAALKMILYNFRSEGYKPIRIIKVPQVQKQALNSKNSEKVTVNEKNVQETKLETCVNIKKNDAEDNDTQKIDSVNKTKSINSTTESDMVEKIDLSRIKFVENEIKNKDRFTDCDKKSVHNEENEKHKTNNELNHLNNTNVNKEDQIIITPFFFNYQYFFSVDEIERELGIKTTPEDLKLYLTKMMYKVECGNNILVKVPDVRNDVLHKVDIIEDIAIAYGYNNLIRSNPPILTIGQENFLSKFANKLRHECAQAGYNEVLTLSLLSKNDSFGDCVTLSNPKSLECEVVRNSLLPGILKSIHSNQHTGVPMKVFEVSDVVLINNDKIYNSTFLCACYVYKTDCLENIIGLCSLLFKKLGLKNIYIEEQYPIYFKNRSVGIYVDSNKVGTLGIIEPGLCNNFRIPFAISSFELNLNSIFEIRHNK